MPYVKAHKDESVSYRDFFQKEAIVVGEIIDYHIQGSVFYGVVEAERRNLEMKQRFMIIIPFKECGDGIIEYRILLKTYNPEKYCDAPNHLLDLLTPIWNHYWSWEKPYPYEMWRETCRERNKQKATNRKEFHMGWTELHKERGVSYRDFFQEGRGRNP